MKNKMEETKGNKQQKRLTLKEVSGKDGLYVGIKSDGKKYTVRKDRHRYFFPEEWIKLNWISEEDLANNEKDN